MCMYVCGCGHIYAYLSVSLLCLSAGMIVHLCVSRRGCSAWCWTRTQTWQWKWSICYCWSKCEWFLCLWWFPCATIRNIQYRNFLEVDENKWGWNIDKIVLNWLTQFRVSLSLCFSENNALQVNLALAVTWSIYFIQLVFGLCTLLLIVGGVGWKVRGFLHQIADY